MTLQKLTEFVKRSIASQEQLKNEHGMLPFPEWNKGYLEALVDIQALLNDSE